MANGPPRRGSSGGTTTATLKPMADEPAVNPVAGDGTFHIKVGKTRVNHRVVIYGPGGVGKTTLAALVESVGKTPLFLDIDDGAKDFEEISCIERKELLTFDQVLAALRSPLWKEYDTVVLDSVSRIEDLAAAHVLATIPVDSHGTKANSIEDYGFGKGYTLLYEQFLKLIAELDRHFQEGRNVILIAHYITAGVPNPKGEDYSRYEPRLQTQKSGRASIRSLVREWTDHLLYVDFDVSVDRDGKAKGGGTRTIYTSEMPTFWAKSRSLKSPQIPYPDGGVRVWEEMFNTTQKEG